jgi:hypothetical protein
MDRVAQDLIRLTIEADWLHFELQRLLVDLQPVLLAPRRRRRRYALAA